MIVYQTAGKAILIVFMLVCALSDLRSATVDIRIFTAMLLAEAVTYAVMTLKGSEIEWVSLLVGGLQGGLLGAISYLTKGSLGAGDALFFLLTGFALGWRYNALFILGTFAVAAMIGLITVFLCIIKNKAKTDAAFPLLPAALLVGVPITVLS